MCQLCLYRKIMIQQWKILSFFPFIHSSQFNWINLPKAWLRSYYSKHVGGSPLSTELRPDTFAWYLRPYTDWPQLTHFHSPYSSQTEPLLLQTQPAFSDSSSPGSHVSSFWIPPSSPNPPVRSYFPELGPSSYMQFLRPAHLILTITSLNISIGQIFNRLYNWLETPPVQIF